MDLQFNLGISMRNVDRTCRLKMIADLMSYSKKNSHNLQEMPLRW